MWGGAALKKRARALQRVGLGIAVSGLRSRTQSHPHARGGATAGGAG